MEAALIVFFALLGMTIASFLNVCIDRLPENESLIFPASHCSSCNHRLSVKDLIPVFSYLWLRGRCRYCQTSIPRRILWVEIGTGVLFAFLYWYYGLTAELAVTAFFSSLLIVIMVIDLERGLILNKLVYPGMVIALIVSIFLPPHIAKAAIGGGIGFGLFILIALISRGGMGWGDVKLATLLGLVTGFPLVFIALLLAIIFGGLVAIVLLMLKIRGRKEPIPFGPFLSLSIIVTMLWGNNILDWYLNLNLF
jgi:leader peptidase (prepilin peptidase)/N-methyltransferase